MNLPAEIDDGLTRLAPALPVRNIVLALAAERAMTAEAETPQDIGLRPAEHGSIAVYVNTNNVDLRLDPETARPPSEQDCPVERWGFVDRRVGVR